MALLSDRRRYLYGTKELHYDAEVEYLETSSANGGGFINTGYIPKSLDIEIQCGFMPIELPHTYSVWFSNGSPSSNVCNFRVIKWNVNLGVANFSTNDYDYTVLPITEYGKKYDIILRKNVGVVNGEEVELSTHHTNSANNTTPITIFDRIDGLRPSYGRCYYFRILQNNNVILDLIPVRIGNTGYMYDKVSGKLFGNEGSGEFILGPDIVKPYDAEVEYLETNAETGQAFIDTGYVPEGNDIDMYATLNISSANTTSYPFVAESGVNLSYYGTGWTGPSDLYIYNGHSYRGGLLVTFRSKEKMKLTIKANGYIEINYGDGDVITYQNTEDFSSKPNTSSMKIFNSNLDKFTYIKFYSFRLDKGGETVLDLIPVRKDGKGYMYNKVDGKLYGNANEESGSYFIIGPDK